jgi:ribosome biogenesis GTPase
MKALIDNAETLTGVVLNGAHGIYDVHTDNGILRCTLRGKLKKAFARANSVEQKGKTRSKINKFFDSARPERAVRIDKGNSSNSSTNVQPSRLSIGDYVKLRQLDASTGMIEEILPRKSALSRKDSGSTDKKSIEQTMLANLDQVALVFATTQPDPHFGLLDRYLAICEATELQPLICLNKADLPHVSYVNEAANLYSKIGYTVLWTSAQTGQGIDELRSRLKGHTTLFTGPSGVGKSSLVNAIEPGMAAHIGMISSATGKGRHTTTGSQLYPLSGGGWLADSAGIRALTAWDIMPEELASCFIEFRPYLGECEYNDCAHIDEEGCAICQAVADTVIDERRYRSYVRMYLNEER